MSAPSGAIITTPRLAETRDYTRTSDQELKATSTELAPSRLHDLLLTTLLIKVACIVMSGS